MSRLRWYDYLVILVFSFFITFFIMMFLMYGIFDGIFYIPITYLVWESYETFRKNINERQ